MTILSVPRSENRVLQELNLPDETGLVVAVDTEGSGLHPDDGHFLSAISVAWRNTYGEGGVPDDPDQLDPGIEMRAYPFDQGRYEEKMGLNVIPGMEEPDYNLGSSHWNVLLEWLSQQWLIMHNAKHDLHFLYAGTRALAGRDLADRLLWDTMLAAWLLDPNVPIGLEHQATLHLNKNKKTNIPKDLIRSSKGKYGTARNPRYDLLPWAAIESYAMYDAGLTKMLHEHQEARLEAGEGHLRPHIRDEVELCRVLYRMERRGIGYDAARSVEIAEQIEENARQIALKLPFTPTPESASHWFFAIQDAQPHCVTPTGKKSVSECCIRSLVNGSSPDIADAAQQYHQYSKLMRSAAMWYRGYAEKIGADGRLRTDFKQTKTSDDEGNSSSKSSGTISGRLASTRVNLQAMPHAYRLASGEVPSPRALFRPAPSKELWEMDLGQAELRVSARIAKCTKMLELLESGQDAHGYTAIHVLGADPDSDTWKRDRNQAKRMNFSLIYNVGPRTFRLDLEKKTGIQLSEEEAKQSVQGWRDMYPEFPRANYAAERKVKQRGYVKVPGGRVRHFTQDELAYHSTKAFNAVVQGGIAEFMKVLMIQVEEQWPNVLLLQVHDSLVVEIEAGRDDIAKEIADFGAREATRFFDVPMVMDVEPWKGK